MRHGYAFILVAQFALSASAGAQRPSIILVPEIAHGFEHGIYTGVLYVNTLDGARFKENSWVELEPGTRYGLRVEVLTGSGRWGAFVSYGARDAKLRSGDGDSLYSFRRVQDAESQIFTLGALRQFPLGAHVGRFPAPDLRVGLAAVVFRITADRFAGSSILPGPAVRDFFSPGGQLSVGAIQRVAGRFDLRIQGGYALVHHDIEGLDGGGRPWKSEDERLGQWASAIDVSLGVGVRF